MKRACTPFMAVATSRTLRAPGLSQCAPPLSFHGLCYAQLFRNGFESDHCGASGGVDAGPPVCSRRTDAAGGFGAGGLRATV